ncbi:hypothetical protein Rsph17029_0749 [Rhodobacter sphaeroides ATCC 17029]|nr:hypothetical protein Rsph17029_0749 [Cereibacter sphaeroides ATCC 17029]
MSRAGRHLAPALAAAAQARPGRWGHADRGGPEAGAGLDAVGRAGPHGLGSAEGGRPPSDRRRRQIGAIFPCRSFRRTAIRRGAPAPSSGMRVSASGARNNVRSERHGRR